MVFGPFDDDGGDSGGDSDDDKGDASFQFGNSTNEDKAAPIVQVNSGELFPLRCCAKSTKDQKKQDVANYGVATGAIRVADMLCAEFLNYFRRLVIDGGFHNLSPHSKRQEIIFLVEERLSLIQAAAMPKFNTEQWKYADVSLDNLLEEIAGIGNKLYAALLIALGEHMSAKETMAEELYYADLQILYDLIDMYCAFTARKNVSLSSVEVPKGWPSLTEELKARRQFVNATLKTNNDQGFFDLQQTLEEIKRQRDGWVEKYDCKVHTKPRSKVLTENYSGSEGPLKRAIFNLSDSLSDRVFQLLYRILQQRLSLDEYDVRRVVGSNKKTSNGEYGLMSGFFVSGPKSSIVELNLIKALNGLFASLSKHNLRGEISGTTYTGEFQLSRGHIHRAYGKSRTQQEQKKFEDNLYQEKTDGVQIDATYPRNEDEGKHKKKHQKRNEYPEKLLLSLTKSTLKAALTISGSDKRVDWNGSAENMIAILAYVRYRMQLHGETVPKEINLTYDIITKYCDTWENSSGTEITISYLSRDLSRDEIGRRIEFTLDRATGRLKLEAERIKLEAEQKNPDLKKKGKGKKKVAAVQQNGDKQESDSDKLEKKSWQTVSDDLEKDIKDGALIAHYRGSWLAVLNAVRDLDTVYRRSVRALLESISPEHAAEFNVEATACSELVCLRKLEVSNQLRDLLNDIYGVAENLVEKLPRDLSEFKIGEHLVKIMDKTGKIQEVARSIVGLDKYIVNEKNSLDRFVELARETGLIEDEDSGTKLCSLQEMLKTYLAAIKLLLNKDYGRLNIKPDLDALEAEIEEISESMKNSDVNKVMLII